MYIYIYMVSVLGIVIVHLGIYFVFGYLDPFGCNSYMLYPAGASAGVGPTPSVAEAEQLS